MDSIISGSRLRFLINQFRNRLWIRPLAICLLSIAAAFVAKVADDTRLVQYVPLITVDSIETLLSILASSMLVIATFSVSSMVSAYASAGSTATPRSFSLILADDVSQNALSAFIGAFIFSIVALTAVKNEFFGKAGLFILFALTVMVFGVVIITFVHWVDRIARLGRLESTIDKVEKATAEALQRRRNAPTLEGLPLSGQTPEQTVFSPSVGYVQYIDVAKLQTLAEKANMRIVVAALPGVFVYPGRPLAYIGTGQEKQNTADDKEVIESFQIGTNRLFTDDPRFGLVVLSQIASRALSPAVNDPGTAIDIIGTMVRLFAIYGEPTTLAKERAVKYDRVELPEISMEELFDDAFAAIARDGAGMVEVLVRLEKALHSLTLVDNMEMQGAAMYHAQLAFKRGQRVLNIAEDVAAVRKAANFAMAPNKNKI